MQTTVFSGPLNFPAVPAYPRPPAPPDAPVPFTTPHVYLGTDPLLWEVSITSASPFTPTQFYERGPGSTHVAGAIGTGCTITGGSTAMNATGMMTVSLLTDSLTNGPTNAAAALVIGDVADKLGGVIPLPVDLVIIGSPGCFVNINALMSIPMQTTAAGGAMFTLTYTVSPALSGARLRTQWAAVDSANRLRTSNGLDQSMPYNATTGKPWPQSRVHAYGFGSTPPLTGTVELVGVVTTWIL